MDSAEIVKSLKRYVELDKEIQALESKNVRKMYKEMKDKVDDITKTIQELEKGYEKAKEKTAKEKQEADVLLEKKMKNLVVSEKELDKEQAEYLEALGEQQALEKQIGGVKEQKEKTVEALGALEADKKKLEEVQKEQDELLDKVFKGSYGSDVENDLEKKLDIQLEKEQLIKAAEYRWKNGKVLLDHACKQFGVACKKWADIKSVKLCPETQEKVYTLVTEARNNLLAGRQNVQNAQGYLNNIKFPYCQENEMKTIDQAIHNIYTDFNSKERHSHAEQCYVTTFKRCCALCQWFNQVINERIMVDMKAAKTSVKDLTRDLRKERIRLMKEMAGDDGQNIDIQESDDFKDDEPEPELLGLVSTDESSDQQEGMGRPTPMPKGKLAALPADQDLFGDIEQLKQQYAKQETDSKRTQEFNKARMQQGLQEKLAARQARRDRNARSCE